MISVSRRDIAGPRVYWQHIEYLKKSEYCLQFSSPCLLCGEIISCFQDQRCICANENEPNRPCLAVEYWNERLEGS